MRILFLLPWLLWPGRVVRENMSVILAGVTYLFKVFQGSPYFHTSIPTLQRGHWKMPLVFWYSPLTASSLDPGTRLGSVSAKNVITCFPGTWIMWMQVELMAQKEKASRKPQVICPYWHWNGRKEKSCLKDLRKGLLCRFNMWATELFSFGPYFGTDSGAARSPGYSAPVIGSWECKQKQFQTFYATVDAH